MNYKDKIISSFAKDNCEKVTEKVIKKLQEKTEDMQSEDYSPLKNYWEAICIQIQDQLWTNWETFLDIASNFIEKEVDRLNVEIKESIWFQTDEGKDWDEDNKDKEEENIIGKNNYSEFYFIQIEPKIEFVEKKIPDSVEYNVEDITEYILRDYILKKASDWTNKRVEKYKQIHD